jgi:hypothetical protein
VPIVVAPLSTTDPNELMKEEEGRFARLDIDPATLRSVS